MYRILVGGFNPLGMNTKKLWNHHPDTYNLSTQIFHIYNGPILTLPANERRLFRTWKWMDPCNCEFYQVGPYNQSSLQIDGVITYPYKVAENQYMENWSVIIIPTINGVLFHP